MVDECTGSVEHNVSGYLGEGHHLAVTDDPSEGMLDYDAAPRR